LGDLRGEKGIMLAVSTIVLSVFCTTSLHILEK